MIKRIFTLLLTMLTVTFVAVANPVDMQTAREVAIKFMNAKTETPLRNADDLQLVTTYNISRGDVAFYVFNTRNGFVIISADDCAKPILGYSDEGRFDLENIPIQLQDYLQDFVEQIQYGVENHLEADEATARQWVSVRTMGHLIEQRATAIVAPLITSKWGQSCGYNNYCPIEPYGPCGHALVGCVATAYSQILRYWGYPSIGKGSFTYTPPGYPTQTVDFDATTYDWVHMPNWLTETSTSTEINAVATLMWHCGVAANMQYGASASGTSSIFVAPALLNYFDYSDDLSFVYRQDYSDEEWLNIMKDCLDLGRPIYYSGTGGAGGHAFVCDGYDSDDFLHFNWGWSGAYDGYFALDALEPGNWVFSGGNEAIINIHPKCVSGTTYQVSASVNPSGAGSVFGMGYYDFNTVCSLTAEPNVGYVFHSWTENGVLVSSEPTYSFNVAEDRNLVANFSEEGSVCNIVFDLYDTYEWFGWFGNYLSVDYGNGVTEQFTLVNSTSASYSRSVITGSTITLNWISVSNINNCAFDISYENGYPIYHGENLGSDFQYEFTVDCDAANAPRVISLAADPVEGGSVSGAGMFEFGDVCTVVASPSDGFFFANWTENGAVVSNDAAYSFVVMEDCALTAHFVTNENIVFADDNVKALCVQNWDTNGDGELSYYEASMVTSLGEVFSYNTLITSFEELQYFIGLSWIDDNAFSGCSSLTGSLILPNSITRIGYNAFFECSGLTGSLTIPNTVTLIDDSAFEGCSGFTGPLIIPNSVTSIGDWAFEGCSGFTGTLTISNSVTSIGGFTFYNCNGFTGALTIPNSVTSIGYHAFSNCSGLTGSLTIPNSVTSIGEYAFNECYGFIDQLIIGSSVVSIGEGAFSYCMGLNSVVVLPLQPPMIGTDVFDEDIPIYVLCKSEEAYQMADGWHSYPNLMGMCSPGTITVAADPEEGGRVSGGGFYGGGNYCIVIASPKEGYHFVNWTENGRVVSYESNYSFIVTGESVLTAHFAREGNIVFADARVKARCVAHWDTNGDGELSYFEAAMVTDLGSVFMNNRDITSFDELQYFTGLTFIGSFAFYYCTSMTSIVLPNSLTTIESSAFWACWNLNAIDLPNSVSFIGGNAFYDCHKLTSVTIPNSVTTIQSNPFVYCTRLDRIIVEEGNLVYDSRDNCNAIINTNNNELVAGCKNTFIPNSVTSIGNYAFENCTSLTSILIPNSVASIGQEAFSFCGGLTSITIPSSVVSINIKAFEYCYNLTSITVFAETPPSLGSNAFFYVDGSIPVYVPCASLEAYQNTVGWNAFTNILGICPGVITVEVLPEEGGMVTGEGLYEGGDTCTLTATANAGYTFMYWTDEGEQVSSNASYSFFVAGDRHLMAIFALPFTITASADPVEGGTVSGMGAYDYGTTATLTATADFGYAFMYWTEDGERVSPHAEYAFTVHGDRQLVAHFTTIPPTPVHAEYHPDPNEPNSPYVKVHWTEVPSEVQIGEGTSAFNYFPFYTNFDYTIAENLFLSNELSAAGMTSTPMTSLSWYANNAPGYEQQGISIWMANVSDNVLTMNSHTVTDMTLVYSGSMTPEIGWNEFVFNEGTFTWDGVSNVLILCQRNNGQSNSAVQWQSNDVGFKASSYRYQIDNPFNVNVSNQMNTSTMRPNIIMKIGSEMTYNLYRANCDGTNAQLIAENLGDTQYTDRTWWQLENGNYQYGISVAVSTGSDVFWSNCIEKQGDAVVQTVVLSEGWNWFSLPIAVDDPEEAMLMLQAVLGENGLEIKSRRDGFTTYDGEEWGATGNLEELENEQMYMIKTSAACTLVLQGQPASPEDYTITIRPGWNWIGFPSVEEIDVENAFAGFEAEEGDQIKSRRNGFTTYEDGEWGAMGSLEMLVPGQGYMYYYNGTQPKPLIFRISSKSEIQYHMR